MSTGFSLTMQQASDRTNTGDIRQRQYGNNPFESQVFPLHQQFASQQSPSQQQTTTPYLTALGPTHVSASWVIADDQTQLMSPFFPSLDIYPYLVATSPSICTTFSTSALQQYYDHGSAALYLNYHVQRLSNHQRQTVPHSACSTGSDGAANFFANTHAQPSLVDTPVSMSGTSSISYNYTQPPAVQVPFISDDSRARTRVQTPEDSRPCNTSRSCLVAQAVAVARPSPTPDALSKGRISAKCPSSVHSSSSSHSKDSLSDLAPVMEIPGLAATALSVPRCPRDAGSRLPSSQSLSLLPSLRKPPSSRTLRKPRTIKCKSKNQAGQNPFINLTADDHKKILTGVAPSGGEKTKAKREKERTEWKKKLERRLRVIGNAE